MVGQVVSGVVLGVGVALFGTVVAVVVGTGVAAVVAGTEVAVVVY
jgi:hypothetical protein